MLIERKTFDAAEFKTIDAAQGIAEMIVSVFSNTDSMNERILPGFFAESLATRQTAQGAPRVKGVWSHNWDVPIAKTLAAEELMPGDQRLPRSIKDLGGLWVRGQFNMETQRGREAFSDLQFGSIDEFSIGYSVLDDHVDSKTGIRDLITGELYEWSPVLVGANPATALMSVKSIDPDAFGRAFAAALATDGSIEDQVKAAVEALALPDPEPIEDDPDPSDDAGSHERFADHTERVLLEVSALTSRATDISALRAKAGRVLSAATRRRLQSLMDELGSLLEATAQEDADPDPKSEPKSAEQTEIAAMFDRLDTLAAIYAAPSSGGQWSPASY